MVSEESKHEKDYLSEESESDEMEAKAFESNNSESRVIFTSPLPNEFDLLICSGKLSKTLAKIMYSDNWTLIGKGETEKKEETKDTLEIYQTSRFVIVVPTEKFAGG